MFYLWARHWTRRPLSVIGKRSNSRLYRCIQHRILPQVRHKQGAPKLMAKTGTFIKVANPAEAKNPVGDWTIYFDGDSDNPLFTTTTRAKALAWLKKHHGIKAYKTGKVRIGQTIWEAKNPVKFWILDQNGDVYLTVTKGGREKAEKIADDLTKSKGKAFSVMGFGVENPTNENAYWVLFGKRGRRDSEIVWATNPQQAITATRKKHPDATLVFVHKAAGDTMDVIAEWKY